jgi:hypothetical protein
MSSSPSTWTTRRPDNDLKDNPFRFCYEMRTGPGDGSPQTGTCQRKPAEEVCYDQFPTYQRFRPRTSSAKPKEDEL